MAVGRSLRVWDQVIPREPFKFGQGPEAPSVYEVETVVRGVRYAYRVEVDDSAVLFEGLYSYPERRRRVLFERGGLEIHFRRGLGALAGTRELLTPTTLALSAAMRFDDPEVRPFGRYLAGIRVLGARRRAAWRRLPVGLGYAPGLSLTERLFDSRGSTIQPSLFDDIDLAPLDGRESALALLRFADLGIDDVQIVEAEEDDTRIPAQPRRRLRLIHRVEGQELPVDSRKSRQGRRHGSRSSDQRSLPCAVARSCCSMRLMRACTRSCQRTCLSCSRIPRRTLTALSSSLQPTTPACSTTSTGTKYG